MNLFLLNLTRKSYNQYGKINSLLYRNSKSITFKMMVNFSDAQPIVQQKNLVEVKQTSIKLAKSQFEMYPIEKYEVGQRLDRYLKSTKLNWTMTQKFLRNKQIFIKDKEGQRIRHNDYHLQQGDLMYVKNNLIHLLHEQKNMPSYSVSYEYAKSKLDDMTIFDNKNITILNKPSSYSVQGGDEIDRNLFSLMSARYKKQFVYVIHRLDKPTSGVLFFCKNLKTAQFVQAAIEGRTDYNKYYLAVTIGDKISQNEEFIRCNIQWTNKHKARVIESIQKEDSKDCITYYKKIHEEQLDNSKQTINLLGMKLITGRKHQIRCHLNDYLNNPILNDRRYGGVLVQNTDVKKVKNNEQQKDQKRRDQDSIYLHALMTSIKNDQIAQQVFQISQDKLIKSKKSVSSQLISSNEKGTILLKNGEVKIIANLPTNWQKLNQTQISSNIPHLKNIKLTYKFDQLQIGEEIQKSENIFWKRHRPQRNVVTIN